MRIAQTREGHRLTERERIATVIGLARLTVGGNVCERQQSTGSPTTARLENTVRKYALRGNGTAGDGAERESR